MKQSEQLSATFSAAMFKMGISAFVLSTMCAVPCFGQEYHIGSGRVVRLTLHEEERFDHAFEAVVADTRPDTLLVVPRRMRTGTLAVPLSGIKKIELVMGRDRLAGGVLGAILGASIVGGGLYALMEWLPSDSGALADGQAGAFNGLAATFWGVVVGAPVGIFVGRRSLAPPKWQAISTSDLRLSLRDTEPFEGATLGMRIRLR